jgi:azurin
MIGVTPAVMKFDTNAFEVQAGQKVMLLFKNEKCPLPHNIVICKPGTKDKVAAESLKFAADPNAMAAAFIPSTADIIFKGSKLVMTGQTDLLEFTAPTDAGDYPFLCTYPGHTMTMHGIMTVKK